MYPTDKKVLLWQVFGFLLSVLPPLLATLLYFPLWNGMGGGATLSGLCVMLLAVCVLPLWRTLRKRLSCASVWVLWLCLFLFFTATAEIVFQMQAIAFVGLVGNLLGALCFRRASRLSRRENPPVCPDVATRR